MDQQTVHDRRWWALAVMCMSLGIISLDNTVLNLAIPALVRDLGASTSELQYIIDGYTLVFAGLLLTSGSLGDRLGRRKFLGIGLVIFCVGSAISALATEPWHLIATRALMGLGGCLIMPSTLSLLTNIFTDPKERGRAIGVWAAVAGAGSALGPLLAGVLLEHYWWGSVFLINVPVTLIALVGGRYLLPEFKEPSSEPLDPVGALLSIVGLVVVLWAIIEAPAKGWAEVGPIVAVGIAVLVAFVLWELRTPHPMLDVRFFENRRFTVASATLGLTFFSMFATGFLFTQYLQTVLGFSALESGVRLLPMPLCMIATSTLSPRLAERIGSKVVVTAGLGTVATGLLIVAAIPGAEGYAQLVVGMCIMAGGMGLIMAPATESVMGSLPPAKAGVGAAMNDATRYVGGALGVAIVGSIFASAYRSGISEKVRGLDLGESALGEARDSVGGAMNVAAELPVSAGRMLAEAARIEFADAMTLALVVSAVIMLATAGFVLRFLPARAGDARQGEEGALDGIASLTFAEAEGVLERDATAAAEAVR